MLADGKGGDVDMPRAIDSFQRACSLGDAPSCTHTGFLHAQKGEPQYDARKALKFYGKGCEADRPKGCEGAGVVARDHLKNPADAVPYFQRACDLDHLESCSTLGTMHSHGEGTAADTDKASEYYARACPRLPFACANQGIMVEEQLKDFAGAKALYEQACALDSDLGCERLAALYLYGKGVRQDGSLAVANFEKACELGRGSSCGNASLMYSQGVAGVPIDAAKAAALRKKACELGNQKACG